MEQEDNLLQIRLTGSGHRVLCLAVPDAASCLDHVGLSELDRSRLGGLQRASRRREFVRSRQLLYQCAAQLTGSEASDWQLSNAPGEAPVLRGLEGHLPELHASLSHGGQWTAAVVSTRSAVGIDVETGERSIQRTGIARYLGWPKLDSDRWLEHWTLWEAAAKCERQSVFARHNPAFHALAHTVPLQLPGSQHRAGFHHTLLAPDEAHRLSIVLKTGAPLEMRH